MIDKKLLQLPGIKKILMLLAGSAVLQAIFIIGQAYGLAMAITHLWNGEGLNNQINWLVLFFASFALRHLMTYLREHFLEEYAYQQAKDLRGQLLRKIFRLGPEVVQKQGTGSVVTTALDGINQVEEYLHLILPKMLNMMIIPWILLVAIFLLDWESGVVLLIVFPLIIIFMIILGYAAQSKADKQYKVFQILSNHFIDSLRGIDTLKFFGISKQYSKSIYTTSERFRKATMSTLKVAILSTFALDFFTTLSVAVVAVLLGLRLINEGIFLFPALTVLILAPEYFLPIRDFSSDYHATLDGKNAMDDVNQILELSESQTATIGLPTWSNDSRLTVDMRYNYAEKLGAEVDFTVQGYKKIGIIGMSGSGKSTLINLLSGFLRPDESQISLNEQTIPAFDQPQWQEQLIYIPQNPYIFQRSVRENIAFYHPQASDEEILKAVEVTGLTELLQELPEGLDTILGEGARTLSGGQAQRIALARAFLDQERKILLFDEPTAHLDIETEVELKERMLPLMENHLVFFATHRLHWLAEMDYLLVMDHGKLVEQGTLEELKQKNGAFTTLSQALRGDEA
ncbi:thiol reductant ABC exporter subunit CydD [Enterococcus hulanensis]|uniref:Thiol reductant ABC exporter subunit CydD n=1 Tax=Enterococcus hulanensis TaxID=2559929 RepID=A0ABU3F559_9ENTE|nr:thiol reductant ABC exporter subunit CydD [Enterococcus hulanensis]MDT2602076.1 thiol reductant ABC exporter subunit CydD [Enterococcus hulanensis]MDT2608371.1 thiol reductant ABC exporter subunit CydD [Enterococcus hulanensis]MDT2615666.1 thiol reductant ABC exporter subunit CydD [Enterococcus hulanensis]MDT2630148.1 thiol reductant ABC exporter subunit CydD [Enterococcus hulanensis]MDT2654738.1 thiol reductant ABC exporter subunit CydD [Enterococcus hulanensis]